MITQSIHQKQTTNQVMTPQLQEAIRLLQLSHEELLSFMDQQMVENPFLNSTQIEDVGAIEPNNFDDHALNFDYVPVNNSLGSDRLLVDDFYSNLPNPELDLKSFVLKQFREMDRDLQHYEIAILLTEHLNKNGYFVGDIKRLAQDTYFSLDMFKNVLALLKKCEPCGIFASNMEECLVLQLREKGLLTDAAEKIVHFLPDLVKGLMSPKQVGKKLGLSLESVQSVLSNVRRLQPVPGRLFDNRFVNFASPEVVVFYQTHQQKWRVMLAPHARHSLSFNQAYYHEVQKHNLKGSEKKYINQQFLHANWLCKALTQRTKTLLDVSQAIVEQQHNFFDKGITFLKPLILKDISEPLGIHESTVSRITTGKYIMTPLGTFELKYFFNSGFKDEQGENLSSSSLKQSIKNLIERENPKKPLSDLVIANILETRSIPIARRTIAKYREALNIPSSFERKRAYFLKSWHKNLSEI